MQNIMQFQVEDMDRDMGVCQAVCQDTICLSRDMDVFKMTFLSSEIHGRVPGHLCILKFGQRATRI